jgi:sensor histidine kinase YesM
VTGPGPFVVEEEAAAGRLADFARGVLRRLRPRVLLGGLGLFLAIDVAQRIAYSAQTRYPIPRDMWKTQASLELIAVVALGLSVLAADEAVSRGARRASSYLLAVLLGTLLATLVQSALPFVVSWESARFDFLGDMVNVQPIRFSLQTLIYGSMACFIYVNHRTAGEAAARMHAAELARARSRRRTFESRLQAMQARVEPQFLFNTLAQVGELYEREPAQAGQMLDDLISYLRAALPHLRESSSTLGRELDLARSYLDIMRVRLGDRLSFDIDVPDDVKSARMPPMILLPLIDHALVYGLQPGNEKGSIRIETSAALGRLHVSIRDSGAGFVPEGKGANLASIGERLAALYGDNARFELARMRDRGTRATLEIPYETTDLRDR